MKAGGLGWVGVRGDGTGRGVTCEGRGGGTSGITLPVDPRIPGWVDDEVKSSFW